MELTVLDIQSIRTEPSSVAPGLHLFGGWIDDSEDLGWHPWNFRFASSFVDAPLS